MLLWAWLAATPVHSSWSELEAWRTWLVLEDIQTARHWFLLEKAPLLGKRCEVGVLAEGRKGPAVVWCGPARIGDAGLQDTPAELSRQEAQARAALAPYLGAGAKLLEGERMRYLGTLRGVTFRQIVVTEQNANPALARTIELTATWQVDTITGRVDRGPVQPSTRLEALCVPGLHPGCDSPPRLMDWTPEPGWEGMLYDAGWIRGDVPVDAGLARAVRAAALSPFEARSPREVTGGPLADDMDAAAVLTLVTSTVEGERRYLVDLPINDLLSGAVIVRFPVDGTPAQLEVIARLQEQTLEVSLKAPALEPAGIQLSLRCDVLVDGNTGVLLAPCATDAVGQWAGLLDQAGTELVRVRVEGTVEPLVVPSVGPGLR